jgi:hypothetical protein
MASSRRRDALRGPRIAALAVGVALAATALTGCGGSDEESSAATAAPSVSDFLDPDGRTLEQVLSEAGAEGPVVSPSSDFHPVGETRYSFGVFETGGEQIADADVAVYVARDLDSPAQGPYPARIDDLSVEGPFQSRTTAEDPDAAEVVYVTEVDFKEPGKWIVAALVRSGDSFQASLVQTAKVGEFVTLPQPGDKAPSVHTPTEDDVSDLAQIDTRDPHDTMHEDDLADVLGQEPVVLLFASPALCPSRVCGPVVDVAEQVKSEYGDEAAFIHVEPYQDNVVDKGLNAPAGAYGLPAEPWLFVIDRNGKVTNSIPGAFSADELESAVQEVTGRSEHPAAG